MPRARNIKPGFFRNELLAQLPATTRLLYAGLWTEADRAGRLEDRPLRLKMALLPLDDVDVDAALDQLYAVGFIVRYQVAGQRLIAIPAFEKHQNPHAKEADSLFPSHLTEGVIYASLGRASEKIRQAGLIPDPGSLIPDSSASDDAGAESVPDPAGAPTIQDETPVQSCLQGFALAAVDTTRPRGAPIREIAEAYNAALGHVLPKQNPGRIRAEIAKAITARWREDRERQSLDWWCGYFARVAASQFLTGSRTDFRATLCWLVGPKNMGKVLDGQYDPAPGQASQLVAARARRQWSAVVGMLPNPREARSDDAITEAVIAGMGGYQRLARLPRFDLQNEMGRFIDGYVQADQRRGLEVVR